MYIFNSLLFRDLVQGYGNNINKVSQDLGISFNTLRRWMDTPDIIPSTGIVKFCNLFRVSLADLVTMDEREDSLKRGNYIIPEEEFIAIGYNKNAISQLLKGEHKVDKTIGIVAQRIDVHERTANSWLKKPESMRLSSILRLCNEYSVNINRFFMDPNKTTIPPYKGTGNGSYATLNKLKEEMDALKIQNEQKSAAIKQLHEDNHRLKIENEELRNYKIIEPQLNFSMVSESSPPGYVSEKGYFRYNSELVAALPSILGLSAERIYSDYGLPCRETDSMDNGIKVSRLINACNKMRISIRHFFVMGDVKYVVLEKSSYIVPNMSFRHIDFIPENLLILSGHNSGLSITQAEFCRRMGTTPTRLRDWAIKGNMSALPVKMLLQICNAYNIAPDLFFDDYNKYIPATYKVSTEQLTFTECILLKAQLKKLEERLSELAIENNSLNKKLLNSKK